MTLDKKGSSSPDLISQSNPDSAQSNSTTRVEKNSFDIGITKHVLFLVITAALSSFNSGYNSGATNIPNDTIRGTNPPLLQDCYSSVMPRCLYAQSDILWGFVIGIFALGGCFGSLSAGKIADRFGRKKALIIGNIPFIIGGILLSTASSLIQLAVGRFVVGIGSGASSVLVSCYISEVSPYKKRGFLGSFLQLMMVFGILFSNLIGLGLNGIPYWRILLALTVVPALIQSFLLLKCTETPSFLVMDGKSDVAYTNLKNIRKGFDIEKEFETIVANNQESCQEKTKSSTPLKVLLQRKYFRKLIGIFGLHLFTQISGINGVITYSTTYFVDIMGKQFSVYSSIAVSVINIVFCILGMLAIERFGRKTLLLISLFTMCVSCVLIVIGSVYEIKILVLVFVLVYISGFAIGLGPIPWLLISEMFPTEVLGVVSSISVCINWLANFAVIMSFLYINNTLKSYTFLLFGAICLLGFGFVVMFIPETKIDKSTQKTSIKSKAKSQK